MRYAVWNNKGGVGKTFISFVLSTEYAKNNPQKKVIVVDMCPQANLSEAILGGNGIGSKNLSNILNNADRKTIGGYFDNRFSSPHQLLGRETDYILQCNEYNSKLPENLLLICGDPSLEIQAQAINQASSQTLPVDSWKNLHLWLHDLLQACIKKYGNNETVTVFIDCNPSFSAYTELAILASERLIIPCTSDGSSARAIDNVFGLVYGVGINKAYEKLNFFAKVKEFGLSIPVINCVLLNRSTQYDKKASLAHDAMFNAIKVKVDDYESKYSVYFSTRDHFVDIPDYHSVAIVCSHLGCMLSDLNPGKKVIHDKEVQINPGPLERYQAAFNQLLSKIEN